LPSSVSEPPLVTILGKEGCGEMSLDGDMEYQIVNQLKKHMLNLKQSAKE
jgi:hypothetical protein